MIVIFKKFEIIVGKGENAGYQHFPFPTMFSKGFFYGLCGNRFNNFGLAQVIEFVCGRDENMEKCKNN